MFACQPDAGRVRTFIACFFREDHLVADIEMLEARVEHAVFVKVNLAAIRRLDKAIAFFGKELADFSVRRRVMRLHIVAQRAANVVLQLPTVSRDFERIGIVARLVMCFWSPADLPEGHCRRRPVESRDRRRN